VLRAGHRYPHVMPADASYPAVGHDRPTIDPVAVIARTLRLYRMHARLLITIAAGVFVPLGVIMVGLAPLGRTGLAVATVLNLAAMFLVQGGVVWTVIRHCIEGAGAPTLGDVMRASREWFWPLTAASLLAAVSVVAGLALLIVPGLILLTWWVALPPVIVIERPGVIDGFRRARRLVRGRAWPVFAIASSPWRSSWPSA